MRHRQVVKGLASLLLTTTLGSAFQPTRPLAAQEYAEGACPVTTAYESGIKGPIPDNERFGWYGSHSLAVLIPRNGIWTGSGPKNAWGDKSWWWSQSYNHRKEPVPDLRVTARRLDSDSPPILPAAPTNAVIAEQSIMLVGLGFPSIGCWEVRGEYRGQVLTYIVLVEYDPDIRDTGS
jgi:hypothetical protein